MSAPDPELHMGAAEWGLMGMLTVLWAGSFFFYKVLVAVLPPLTVAASQLAASAALSLPLCALVDRPWTLPMPGAGAWAALAALSVFSTALAYVVFFRILARAGATNASLVTLLVPVGAVLLGALALDETLAPSAWVGMALIALGLGGLDGRPLRLVRSSLRARFGLGL